MKSIEKWAERVYSENDFGRSVATSISSVIGLIIYLNTSDWVIAFFSFLISFPIIRLASTGLHEKRERKKQRNIEKEDALHIFENLSDEEKEVIKSYVNAGGSVLTWGEMNNETVSRSAIESLIQREIMWTSATADGMRETFALDSNIFDIGNLKYGESKSS